MLKSTRKVMRLSTWISTWNQLWKEIRTIRSFQPRFAHPTVPDRLTEPYTGSTRVCLEMNYGWNHNQMIELTVPQTVFLDLLDNPRLIVEPDLAWVMRNPKTIMHSHFLAIWFILATVSSTLPPCSTHSWTLLIQISLRQGLSIFLKTWLTFGQESFVKNTRPFAPTIPSSSISLPLCTHQALMNLDSRQMVSLTNLPQNCQL
ncbi:hypothetical protein F2Q70_00004361 [Brassica cretica]|uniref:Uncharacterized protein n=1 Tax=Brassica cretica TaxID=69181 RepID=A0A8S9IYN7_BRACR|nr:hypothetical protein F2Q70_00004361 [Brassica cretica]